MMSEPLFIVTDTFQIRGRGTVLVGVTLERYALVKLGDRLLLKWPNGSQLMAVVKGVEYPPSIKWTEERPSNPQCGVLVDCPSVPVGTEVFLT